MSNTSTIHIKTDFDCKVYDYGQELGTTKADTYFNIELRKGEHELTFVFIGDESISKTIDYIVKDVDCDYRSIIEIAETICDKAKEHLDLGNYSTAFALYSLAAEKGQAKAQIGLGICYEEGVGIEKNLTKAVEWYTKAAEQGNATAQCNLGFCYDNGSGVEQNLAKAVEWYTKAAEQGYVMAQFTLGFCYEHGTCVETDLAKAVEWYTKAAKQGDITAREALGRLKPNRTNCIEYLFFDTETAGLPRDYNAPTHILRNWPRLVQLSWITTDEDCNVLSENDFIIYPDGFTIPTDAAHLNGITTSIAKEKGWPLEEVIDKFMEDFNAATTIVGHNIDFDKKIIGAELIRLGQKDIMDSKESICTMEASTDYCKIPGSYGYKWPKLQELHKKLFGCEFENAHNSMSDVTATLKCFKEMRRIGLINNKP